MPEEGIRLIRHEDILSYDEINEFTRVAVRMGINKVRITGGEPLVRKGIITLVGMLASVNGVDDLSMTTNGALLDRFASQLAEAGLNRVNISLDTINPDQYRYITRGGNLEDVLRGIEAAKKAGLQPVKINCVVRDSGSVKDAQGVAEFCRINDLEVRYINEMDLERGKFSEVEGGTGGNCAICNRLRLTPNGLLKPCLFSDKEFSIRTLGYEEAILRALEAKPEEGGKCLNSNFYNIGG
jgi:cyclic pyranopterin phosphate synthase